MAHHGKARTGREAHRPADKNIQKAGYLLWYASIEHADCFTSVSEEGMSPTLGSGYPHKNETRTL